MLRHCATVTISVTAACAFTVLVGLFGQFGNKALVVGVIDIGHALLLAAAMGGGAMLARRSPAWPTVLAAALSGAVAGVLLILLVAAARAANLRWMLVSLTPVTLNRVGFGFPDTEAAALLAASGFCAAGLGAALVLWPRLLRRVVLGALGRGGGRPGCCGS